MLMVEHHIDVVIGLAQRIAVMHHGALLACDTPAAVMANETVQSAYLGEDAVSAGRRRERHSLLDVARPPRLPRAVARPAGRVVRRARGRRHGAARAQRRREDDDAARDPRARRRARLGPTRRRGADGHVDAPHRPAHASATCPEDRDVFTGLTVAENLRLAERDAEPRYDLVYELFPELEQRASQRAGTLSGGQQQMVAIARALLNDNRVLLVDEPTKGLAPALVAEVAHVLERLAELTTVLLVEQNLGVVRRIARDAIVLDQGRVVHTGDAKALLAQPRLVQEAAQRGCTHEHVPSPDDHRPRARRDVLPDRVRASRSSTG